MSINVTSKEKKEAIEALFSASNDTVVGDNFKFLLWTHEKGLYSGFSKVQKVVKGKKQDKYYGFVIDLSHREFFMEGVSGKHLANTGTNLKEVFANGEPFSDKYLPDPSSSMEVFKSSGYLLGDMECNERPNFGRGIYRLINDYPVLELIIKEYYPKTMHIESYFNNSLNQIQHFFKSNKVTSVRKVLHRKIIYTTWRESESPVNFMNMLLGGNYSHKANNQEVEKYLEKLAKTLEVAKAVIYGVDEERGYHDAPMWYQEVSTELIRETTGRYYNKPIMNCVDYVISKKGKSGIKNLFKYSYASLYHQQAFDYSQGAFSELKDYYLVTRDLTNVPLYPRYLKVAHDVASRNVKLLKNDVDNLKVARVWKKYHNNLDAKIGNYVIYQALTPKEIVEEGTNNSNCVGGYVRSVANGESIILFMRNKDTPSKSWVTLEVRSNHLVQAYATFDRPLDDKAQDLLSSWCKARGILLALDLGGASTLDWDKRRVSSRVMPLDDQVKYHDKDVMKKLEDSMTQEKVVIEDVSRSVSKKVNSFN